MYDQGASSKQASYLYVLSVLPEYVGHCRYIGYILLSCCILYSGKFSSGPNFVLCYLRLIHAFNFCSVYFTQETCP